MTLMVRETFVNDTKGYIFSESEWSEAYAETPGELYKACRSEYGRCASKMYRESSDGPDRVVGWVFVKRMEYEDYRGHGERYYIREAWVEYRTTS